MSGLSDLSDLSECVGLPYSSIREFPMACPLYVTLLLRIAYAMINSHPSLMRPFQLEKCVGFLSTCHLRTLGAGSNRLRPNKLDDNKLRQLLPKLKKTGTKLSS